MTVRFVDLADPKSCLELTNGAAERLAEHGVFLPAGLFVASGGKSYFPDDLSDDLADLPDGVSADKYNRIRVASRGVARACGYSAVAVRYAIRTACSRGREWVTEEDRALLSVLDGVVRFFRDCGGFEQE